MKTPSEIDLIAEAYVFIKGAGPNTKAFIDWYAKRVDELKANSGREGRVVGEFTFDVHSGKLSVAADVIHADMITGSMSEEEANNFNPNRFTVTNYVPKVRAALTELNIQSTIGLLRDIGGAESGVLAVGPSYPGKVEIYAVTGDTITVAVEISDIEKRLSFKQTKQQVIQVLDTFVAKMFQLMDLLENKYFKRQPIQLLKPGRYLIQPMSLFTFNGQDGKFVLTGNVEVIGEKDRSVPNVETDKGWHAIWDIARGDQLEAAWGYLNKYIPTEMR